MTNSQITSLGPKVPNLDDVIDTLVQHAVVGRVMRSDQTARRFFQDVKPKIDEYAQELSKKHVFDAQVQVHKGQVEIGRLKEQLAAVEAERHKILKLAHRAVTEGLKLKNAIQQLGRTDLKDIVEQVNEFWPSVDN